MRNNLNRPSVGRRRDGPMVLTGTAFHVADKSRRFPNTPAVMKRFDVPAVVQWLRLSD